MAIDDQLHYASLPLEVIDFSNASKCEMVTTHRKSQLGRGAFPYLSSRGHL